MVGLVQVSYIPNDEINQIARTSLATIKDSNRQPDKLYLINNYIHEDFRDDWNITIENSPNILAKAWNKGIKKAINDGCDIIIMANMDVFLDRWCVDNLITEIKKGSGNTVLWSANCANPLDQNITGTKFETYQTTRSNYSLFAITPETIEKVGWFDEHYHPCYREDTDYQKRIDVLGFKHLCVGNARYWHLHSTSTRLQKDFDSTREEKKSYYSDKYLKAKWGGDYRNLPYNTPFNNPNFHPRQTKFKIIESDLLTNECRKSTMAENRNFLYSAINKIQPKLIAELGTFYGCSYFTFAQSIIDNDIDCKLYGVDTFGGDVNMSGYPKDVELVFNRIKGYYNDSRLGFYNTTFDKAVDNFKSNSLDVLLIDGQHTYESVKHDFETWLPKLKEDGVVFLHDTNVRKENFGVHQFYDELDYPKDNRCNKYGLGVVFPKGTKHWGILGRVKVYTSIMGGKDEARDDILNYTKSVEGGTSREQAKYFKVNPHLLDINNYDYTVWVDGHIKFSPQFIKDIPELLGNNPIALWRHPDRDNILAEYEECKNRKKFENRRKAVNQINKYKKDMPEGLWAGTVIVRNMRHPKVKQFNDLWWEEIQKGSIRDQISLPYVLRELDIEPVALPGSLWDNKYITYGQHLK